jgi:hypothetical protein
VVVTKRKTGHDYKIYVEFWNNLNLTEVINLHRAIIRKTHHIGIESYRNMKISKIKEHCIGIISVEKKHEHATHLIIVIFMLLSN